MKITLASVLIVAGLTGGAHASETYTLTEGPTAINQRTGANTSDYNINPGYLPGGGDPRFTFSFQLAAALAPGTTTTLIYSNIEGKNVTGTPVLSFSYFGGGLGTNLSNADFDKYGAILVYDGSGNADHAQFRASVTTNAAGVIQYYSFIAAEINAAVPSLFTTFNVGRSVTNPVLSIGSGSISLQYRYLTGGASCAANCSSPVFSEMTDVTIPAGGGNGGNGGSGGSGGSGSGGTNVPEPSSALLLATGLGWLCCKLWRCPPGWGSRTGAAASCRTSRASL